MRISVVICTRDRRPQLAETLERLRSLRYSDAWELVVVDNGSTDGTAALLSDAARTFPVPLRTLAEPCQGASRGRNKGWRAAAGEVIALIDDDCYPAADYLERLRDCFTEASLGFLGGRILLHDPTDYRITIQESEQRVDFAPGSLIETGVIQGANMAVRRAALKSVGGFDIRLGAGMPFYCEDVDLLTRLSAAGWSGAYDPRPLVYHHHRRKTRAEATRLMSGYDRGRGAYYAKCLCDPALRSASLMKWCGAACRGPLRRTLRELRGGLHYLCHSLMFRM